MGLRARPKPGCLGLRLRSRAKVIFKLFSQRRKEESRGSGPVEVYRYDALSAKLRIQIQQILIESIGKYYQPDYYNFGPEPYHNNQGWTDIAKILRREFGVHQLVKSENPQLEILNFLGQCSPEEFIDVLEVCCRYVSILCDLPEYKLAGLSISMSPMEALEEINYRLRQDSFGYQYGSGKILRVDSEFVHEEVVKPALAVLEHPRFAGASAEFLEAHRLYREGKYGHSIHECGKAFESALKCVCEVKGWAYERGDRATELLKIVKSKGLYPEYLDRSFDQLIATLGSALPQLRNNEGAHGQGPVEKDVPRPLAEYALGLCASKIRLLGGLALQKR